MHLQATLPEPPSLELPGFELMDRSELLCELQMRRVVAQAPQRFGVTPWRLAYSIARDGCSLARFFEAQESAVACLLVIRDAERGLFGGFSPCAWRPRMQHTYYGSGESFVFRFSGEEDNEELDCYRWSGVNCFFMLSTKDSLAMGGGEHFAFSLDANLRHGVTGPCSTYNSPPLTTHSFSISLLEAWIPQPQESSLGHEFRD